MVDARYRRVLLVQAPYFRHFTFLELPVGLGYIAESLEGEGIEYEVMDMNLGYRTRDLLVRIDKFRPDCIGYGMFSLGYLDKYRQLGEIKRAFPSIPIVGGGHHFSTFRALSLQECEAIDFAAFGEGEATIVELCRGESPAKIPGMLYREDGAVRQGEARPFVTDLDAIPFPRYRKFELDKFFSRTVSRRPKISIASSRGCPFLCTFCAAHLGAGRRFRPRSAGNVADEIEYWARLGVREFSFVDDNFTMNRERVYAFCDEIDKRGLKGLRLSMDNGIRADRVDREMMKRMKAAGFFRFAIGVESASNSVLERLKKGEKIETIERAVRDATELGFSVLLFFVVNHPGETWADLEKSVALARRYPVDEATFNNLVPYPNTELYHYLKKENLMRMDYPEYLSWDPRHKQVPVFATHEMSIGERERALKMVFKVEREVFRKSLARRLKKLGPLGRWMGYFYSVEPIRNFFMHNGIFRRLVIKPVKKLIQREEGEPVLRS
jgi:anaerobic magnesium-protoporphyrin IX monomethyl ester cyclase